ncbi:L-rhamnose isomerase [Dorea sp. 5-2]|nr:L-rhamnose isomerase [Dorea sp. 5-2]
MGKIERNYETAKECFEEYGVDTDLVLEQMEDVPISVHCWQIDDLTGFEDFHARLTGGIAATGNMGGKPKDQTEYFGQLGAALKLIPGKLKIAAHAVYLDNKGKKIDRDQIETQHFTKWVDFARERGMGLDFNPTYFSHEKSEDGFTLSSADPAVREFWIEHGRRCRRIGEYFGRETGTLCITNHWIPDGYKDITIDKLSPRQRLKESLDAIFEEALDRGHCMDSLESKLFGLGSESYVTGSHEFYTNYCTETKKAILCMDAGHFHPTESVAAKISSYIAFGQELMLHVSRPVRWDSDHVVIVDEETMAIMEEIVRCGALKRVHIGLDFFDASIRRGEATAIGGRAAKTALLKAMLQPAELLRQAEDAGDYTRRLALLEEIKLLPYGFVWEMYCERNNCPVSICT